MINILKETWLEPFPPLAFLFLIPIFLKIWSSFNFLLQIVIFSHRFLQSLGFIKLIFILVEGWKTTQEAMNFNLVIPNKIETPHKL